MKRKYSTLIGTGITVLSILAASSAFSDTAKFKRADTKPTFKATKALTPPKCATGFTVINKNLDVSATPKWTYACAKQETVIMNCNPGLNTTNLSVKAIPITPIEGGNGSYKVTMKYTCYTPQG